MRRVAVWALAGIPALVAACSLGSSLAVGTQGGSVVRFAVTNDLGAPVTIAIDGSVSLILLSGATGSLAVPPSAQWLTWTSAKATDSTNTPIPDDIGDVQVRVSGIQSSLDITNIIHDTTYISAQIVNQTSSRVSIGVYDGVKVSCVSVLRGASATSPGFTKIGYYRLLGATEIRAYSDPSTCTGTYISWRGSALSAFTPKSGLVNLTLTTAP